MKTKYFQEGLLIYQNQFLPLQLVDLRVKFKVSGKNNIFICVLLCSKETDTQNLIQFSCDATYRSLKFPSTKKKLLLHHHSPLLQQYMLYMYKLLLLVDNACLLGFIYYMYTYYLYYTYTTTPAVKCRSATIFATAAPFFYT